MTSEHNPPREAPFSGAVTGAWLFTGERLVRRGGLRIEEGRIVELLDGGGPPGRVRDFPTGLVHPGLVNAHCHLDLSGLRGKVSPGGSFTGWLERVRALRLEMAEADLAAASAAGLEELAAGGVTAVADFSAGGVSAGALAGSGLRGLLLREAIGLAGEREEAALDDAARWLSGRTDGDRVRYGLAPHAPYSAGPALIRGARRLCGRRPLAIHLAEDPAEARFLERGDGPFRDFLERISVPLDGFEPPGCRPVAYLERLGVLDADVMLVHANDLTAAEVDDIAAGGAAVVFCAGTHRFFDRPRHALPELLAAGVPAGLGTDSAASNARLSVAAEMVETRRLLPELAAETVWALGTGAYLGRFFPDAGRIAVGLPADLAVADLGEAASDDSPLDACLEAERRSLLAIAAGRVVHPLARPR